MCYRLGIIGAIEQFLKVTYREVQLMLLHQTFAPFYHGDTTSCVQRVVQERMSVLPPGNNWCYGTFLTIYLPRGPTCVAS